MHTYCLYLHYAVALCAGQVCAGALQWPTQKVGRVLRYLIANSNSVCSSDKGSCTGAEGPSYPKGVPFFPLLFFSLSWFSFH
jgi:hypothetical protein